MGCKDRGVKGMSVNDRADLWKCLIQPAVTLVAWACPRGWCGSSSQVPSRSAPIGPWVVRRTKVAGRRPARTASKGGGVVSRDVLDRRERRERSSVREGEAPCSVQPAPAGWSRVASHLAAGSSPVSALRALRGGLGADERPQGGGRSGDGGRAPLAGGVEERVGAGRGRSGGPRAGRRAAPSPRPGGASQWSTSCPEEGAQERDGIRPWARGADSTRLDVSDPEAVRGAVAGGGP